MKVAKLLAGGAVIVATYHVGKLVGGFKVVKIIADTFEEEFPGVKKYVAERISKKAIDEIFDDPKEEESQ